MSQIVLKQLSDNSSVAARLMAGGLNQAAAANKARLLAECLDTAVRQGIPPDAAVHVLFVPGRIEVLGKHTDYCGGRSMLAAADKGFVVVVTPRQDDTVRFIPAAGGEPAVFPFSGELLPQMGHWSNYPMTVARRVARNFPGALRGADVVFHSDLPPASGMSSSSALIIASFLAMDAVNNLKDRPEYKQSIRTTDELAEYLGCNENGHSFHDLPGDNGVGTFGGSEDHTAILTCRSGMLNIYSYCPVRFEQSIPVPAGYTFAIAASGVEAAKTGAARDCFNRASLLARAVAAVWRSATGRADVNIAAALASSPDAPTKMREILKHASHGEFSAADLLHRFDHFYGESVEIIPAAAAALAKGDLGGFGHWIDRSQRDGVSLLQNQIPETDFLATHARKIGAVAASAFGAGFGGSVWALVAQDAAKGFLEEWAAAYAEAFPAPAARAQYFTTLPGQAAFELQWM